MDFTVDVDMFQNGTQNMFFRTVNDGSRDVTVLCDADGKAIVAPTLGEYTGVLFSVANNGTEIDTITSDSSISAAAVIQACGGSVNVTALDAGASVFLLIMGTHVQFCNADDTTTTPTVSRWYSVEIWGDESCTVRPTGHAGTVYAKVKRTFGMNQGVTDGNFSVYTPTTEYPDPTEYGMSWYVDWHQTGDLTQGITPGVYPMTYDTADVPDVSNYDFNFL